jgi:hypothetical protein
MAAPKKSPPAFPAAPESKRHDDDFMVERGSGLRERETTPAPPPSARSLAAERESVRPTTVPDYDFNALAAGTSSLRHDALPDIRYAPQPEDMTIPVRTATPPPADLAHRLAVLLFHVDGRASIGEIARCVDLPSKDVVEAFVDLTVLGLVELAVPTPRYGS